MKRFAKHAIFYGVLIAIWAVAGQTENMATLRISHAERCGGVVVGRVRRS